MPKFRISFSVTEFFEEAEVEASCLEDVISIIKENPYNFVESNKAFVFIDKAEIDLGKDGLVTIFKANPKYDHPEEDEEDA